MGQEDTGAQAEPEGQEYIDRAYEYWEALEENDMLTMAEDEAEAINRELNILDLERMVRENGEKPAGEWTREDFKDLLRSNSKLRRLKLSELRALFLQYTEAIDSCIYCKRRTMAATREYRAQGGQPFYDLATWTLANRSLDELEEEGYRYVFQIAEAEKKKLARIWRNL